MFIDISTDTELSDVAKLFFGDTFPKTLLNVNGDVFDVNVSNSLFRFEYTDNEYGIIPDEHRKSRLSKIAVYDALSAYTGRTMPWGALTGVRPTKLFYECMRGGMDADATVRLMQKVYRIGKKRAEILRDIVSTQHGNVYFGKDYVNLYVHIPYCTTRCSYCSFVSFPIDKCKAQSREYVDRLCSDILRTREITEKCGKKILSVYIGGGTPTALDDIGFERVLDAVGHVGGVEYTCEAGRPDTVTREKCAIMKAHGVTRACVNPQTLNNDTLAKIGRAHTVDDFYKAYELVREFGFDINCDLIAGLAEEKLKDFQASFDGIKALRPHNITVHSLSRKNGSAIRYDITENADVALMSEYALDNACEYSPYYLYRQKRQAGNLENIGFSLAGKQCINNITTMEETVSVVACGAGAISKMISDGSITRFADLRDVGLYLLRFDEKQCAKTEYLLNALK